LPLGTAKRCFLRSFVEADWDYVSEKGPRQQGGLILYILPTSLSTQYSVYLEQETQLLMINYVLNIAVYIEENKFSRRMSR